MTTELQACIHFTTVLYMSGMSPGVGWVGGRGGWLTITLGRNEAEACPLEIEGKMEADACATGAPWFCY